MDHTHDRDGLGRALYMACPSGLLGTSIPWGALAEQAREPWRVGADVALRWCAPTPTQLAAKAVFARLLEQNTELLAVLSAYVALERYARHLDHCPESPCSCGLTALLTDTP